MHGIVPYADLHVLINVSGENTTTAKRLAVAEENFDDNEGGEEVVFSPARPLAMYGLREPINNEIIKRLSLIVRVNVTLNRTVVVDSD